MKPLYIYVTRHGQTIYNIKDCVQGHCNSDLTLNGVNSAILTGQKLKDIPFNKAYSSDLGRQYQTAKYIMNENSSVNKEVTVDLNFREMGFGEFESGPYLPLFEPAFKKANVKAGDYEALNKKMSCGEWLEVVYLAHKEKGVESSDYVADRLQKGLERIVKDNPDGGNVLVVSSGCAIALGLGKMFPGLVKLLPDNCSVSLVKYENGKFELEYYSKVL